MNTVTCAMETWFLNIYSTFLWPLLNECIQDMIVVFASMCSVSMPNFTSIYALVIMNQTSKVWNFAANLYIDFSHSLVSNDTTNLSGFNSANIDHIGMIVCPFFFWILFVSKPSEIFMILELFPGQILWRARDKWKFVTFYLKFIISRKKYWKNRKFEGRLFW